MVDVVYRRKAIFLRERWSTFDLITNPEEDGCRV
jgi:hypothetical protein